MHLGKHVADGEGPEGGHEDAVGDAPVDVAGVGGEEAIVDSVSDLLRSRLLVGVAGAIDPCIFSLFGFI